MYANAHHHPSCVTKSLPAAGYKWTLDHIIFNIEHFVPFAKKFIPWHNYDVYVHS